jgi:cytochrome c
MSNCKAEARVVSTLPDYARNAHGQLADQKRIIGGVRGIDSLRPAPKSFVASAARQAPTATPSAATAASEGLRLAQQHACLACHGIGNKLVGPALIDIHKKYAAQKVDAARVLAVRIKAGGSGVWGAVPMPAQDHVPDAEIRAMAEWIAKGEFK